MKNYIDGRDRGNFLWEGGAKEARRQKPGGGTFSYQNFPSMRAAKKWLQ